MDRKIKIYEAYFGGKLKYIFQAANNKDLVDYNTDLGYIGYFYNESEDFYEHKSISFNWVKHGYVIKPASEESIELLKKHNGIKENEVNSIQPQINNEYTIF